MSGYTRVSPTHVPPKHRCAPAARRSRFGPCRSWWRPGLIAAKRNRHNSSHAAPDVSTPPFSMVRLHGWPSDLNSHAGREPLATLRLRRTPGNVKGRHATCCVLPATLAPHRTAYRLMKVRTALVTPELVL